MRKFLFLTVVVILTAMLFFLVAYYWFDMKKERAAEFTVNSAIAGTLGSFIASYLGKRKLNKNTESERVRRNRR